VTPEQLPAEPAPPPALKSWASLFHRAEPSVTPSSPSSTAATYPPHDRLAGDKALAGNLLSTTFDNGALKSDDESSAADDSSGASVGSPLCKFLRDYSLNHKSPSLRPRGLTNRSNWCFANAILQALIACPPFYNLVKSLPLEPTPAEVTAGVATQHRQAMKIVSATFEFVDDFEVMSSNFPKLNRRDKGKKTEDLPLGKTFEPTSIYKMLLGLTSDTFKVMEGRQEDAEEFLTFLLNGLNDEMFAATKLPSDVALNGGAAESYDCDDTSVTGGEDGEGDDADEWKEVGPKNKGFVTRRQQTSMRSTPIGDIFQGQIRYRAKYYRNQPTLSRGEAKFPSFFARALICSFSARSSVQHSSGEPTATLQPFFTLQLDIQSENIRSVSDALVSNFGTESLDGYVCTATKKEVEAKRSLSLEELPPILILHLKRFIYSETSGGCQKVLKTIDFPVDLEVPKEIVSINSRNKYQSKKRQYKLFSVVYHNGTEATKGHYVTDVYHTGLAGWLRYDDSMVKAVNESLVLNHFANSVPYILCYRRCDTMVGLDKQNSK
jgi:ubiquitin carboxyl-terminal hydrolase 10